ncbi:hypothetical protein Cgig2_023006 [Carnegiea gigantea]|uniref:Uncharacterized protein n=1 Tax=Carnegiea gigantea TaxID=171969 RepID=A0A9Q1GJR3_9CARY|nr:hypothetical protein Cgig2_023006 [Carnegiea gigantea]
MAVFSDESDTKETKLQIRRPMAHFSKSKCPEGPPSLTSWSEENLKTGEIFLLSSHPNLQKNVPSYQLLHHDIHRNGSHFGFVDQSIIMLPRNQTVEADVFTNLRMPKFSGFGRAKTFDLNEARELISSGRGFCWNSAIRHRLKAALVDIGQLSRADFAYFASIRSSYVCCRCEDSFVQQTIWLSSGHSRGHRFLHPPEFKDYASTPSSLYTLWDQFSRVFFLVNALLWRGNSLVASKSGGPKWSSLHQILILEGAQRGRERSSDQNIQRNEAPSGSRPKFKIIRSQKHLRSPALETEDNPPQTKIPGVDTALSVAPISVFPIQSVPMAPKASDEVRLTLEPLPVTAYRRKLKSIIVCLLDEQGMSNVGGSKLDYGKTVFPPLDDAKNIMDILDCDPSPPACMGESGDMNFKEKLAYEAEQAVIDLKGQIDTLNAIEVIDPATKASLEKTEAYVKESFEDLKTFHWTP